LIYINSALIVIHGAKSQELLSWTRECKVMGTTENVMSLTFNLVLCTTVTAAGRSRNWPGRYRYFR